MRSFIKTWLQPPRASALMCQWDASGSTSSSSFVRMKPTACVAFMITTSSKGWSNLVHSKTTKGEGAWSWGKALKARWPCILKVLTKADELGAPCLALYRLCEIQGKGKLVWTSTYWYVTQYALAQISMPMPLGCTGSLRL